MVSRVEEVDSGLELVRVHANVDVGNGSGSGSGNGDGDGNGYERGNRKGKAPVRPRSPSAHERPDLSVFVRQAVPRAPPAILVRGGRGSGSGSGVGKRVQFDV